MVRQAMVRAIVFSVLLVVSCAYAFWRGGPAERWTAAIFLAAFVGTIFARSPLPGRYEHVEIGVFLVDVAMFLALLAVCGRTKRFWPFWVAGLQGAAVACHFMILFQPDVLPWAYSVMLMFWGYPMCALLIAATMRVKHRSS